MSDNHFKASMIKSALRICGYILLLPVAPWAAVILVVSELVGIAEEMV